MKKLICFTALLFSTIFTSISFAKQLHNYDEIKSAISYGKLIRIWVDYTKCTMLYGKNTVGNSAAVYSPNAMVITNDGNIAASILHFTLHDGEHPLKPVYQYGKYTISKDNILVLTFTTLNASDYTPLGKSSSLRCKIDDSVKVFSHQQGLSLNTNSEMQPL